MFRVTPWRSNYTRSAVKFSKNCRRPSRTSLCISQLKWTWRVIFFRRSNQQIIFKQLPMVSGIIPPIADQRNKANKKKWFAYEAFSQKCHQRACAGSIGSEAVHTAGRIFGLLQWSVGFNFHSLAATKRKATLGASSVAEPAERKTHAKTTLWLENFNSCRINRQNQSRRNAITYQGKTKSATRRPFHVAWSRNQ